MATYAPQVASVFPVGTTVGAYPASGWPAIQLPPPAGVAPIPAATESHAVATDGTVSFTGLTDGTVYYLGADLGGGAWRFSRLTTNPTSNPNIPDFSITDADIAAANKDGVASKPSLRTLGTAAGQAAAGTHASQHAPGGADALDYTAVHLVGTLANMPAASAANNGLNYFATDGAGGGAGAGQLFRSNGSTWIAQSAQAGSWRASNNDLLLANFDPIYAITATVAMAAGFIFLHKVFVPAPMTITNLYVHVATAGSGLTSGQCKAGIYNNAGTLLAQTADQSGVWNTTGIKLMPLTAPLSLALLNNNVDWVWIALLANGTTPPKLQSMPASPIGNATGITNGNGPVAIPNARHRFGFESVGGRTSLLSLSGLSVDNAGWTSNMFWVAAN